MTMGGRGGRGAGAVVGDSVGYAIGGVLVTVTGPHPSGRATAEGRQPAHSRATAAAMCDRWVSAWG